MNVEVVCEECGCKFEKSVKRVNESKKNGSKQYCNKVCRSNGMKTGYEAECRECGAAVYVTKAEHGRSTSKNFFCSHSCSASFFNKGRVRSKETKEKISKSLRKIPDKTCIVCGLVFRTDRNKRKLCSPVCSKIYANGSLPYTIGEVDSLLLEIQKKTGATPSSKSAGRKVYYAACKFYGSWNEAMKELGMLPNRRMGKKFLKCLDGHVADSISEMLVDNWLFQNDIRHERSRPYPNSRMDCDFYLPDHNVWVEYYGLAGHFKSYDEKIERKKKVAEENGFKLIGLLPSDLYPEEKLGEKLKF